MQFQLPGVFRQKEGELPCLGSALLGGDKDIKINSTPNRFTVNNGSIELACYQWGDSSAPPMLLVPGTSQTARNFFEVGPVLAQFFNVIAMDQVGHGNSSRLKDKPYSNHKSVDNITAVLNAVASQPAVLLGASLSGVHCLAVAAKNPQKVKQLILVDGLPSLNVPLLRPNLDLIAKIKAASIDEALEEIRVQLRQSRTAEELKKRFGHQLAERDGSVVFDFDPRYSKMVVAEICEMFWRYVPAIQCHTTLMRGQHSKAVPEDAFGKFQSLINDGIVIMVPGAGHSIVSDNPQGFLEAMQKILAN